MVKTWFLAILNTFIIKKKLQITYHAYTVCKEKTDKLNYGPNKNFKKR